MFASLDANKQTNIRRSDYTTYTTQVESSLLHGIYYYLLFMYYFNHQLLLFLTRAAASLSFFLLLLFLLLLWLLLFTTHTTTDHPISTKHVHGWVLTLSPSRSTAKTHLQSKTVFAPDR